MAQQIQTLFIDDLDGSEAQGTVRFALDGAEYEIDLNEGHSKELRESLAKYVGHARKVSGASRRAPRGAAARRAASIDTTAVRAWAKEQGIDIKERGRVPGDIVEKYRAAQGL